MGRRGGGVDSKVEVHNKALQQVHQLPSRMALMQAIALTLSVYRIGTRAYCLSHLTGLTF